MDKVYIAKLDHHGAFLIKAVGRTAEEAKAVVESKYVDRYMQKHGNDPRTEYWGWGMTRFEAETRHLWIEEMVINEAILIERQV